MAPPRGSLHLGCQIPVISPTRGNALSDELANTSAERM